MNAEEVMIVHTTLEEMGHPQRPKLIQTDTTTATGYMNDTIKQRRTCAMVMHFYLVVKQCQLHVYWGPGYQNMVNYFIKNYSSTHHKRM
jgi:hypothetical protein